MPRNVLLGALVLSAALAGCGDEKSNGGGAGDGGLQGDGGAGEVASALVPAAEGGSVTSADGVLTLSVPAGAIAKDTEISIRVVPRAEWPAEIVETGPISAVYDLQPDGLEFDPPAVTVWAFDGEPEGVRDEEKGFPSLLFGQSRSSDGTIEPHAATQAHYGLEPGALLVNTEVAHLSQAWISYLRWGIALSSSGTWSARLTANLNQCPDEADKAKEPCDHAIEVPWSATFARVDIGPGRSDLPNEVDWIDLEVVGDGNVVALDTGGFREATVVRTRGPQGWTVQSREFAGFKQRMTSPAPGSYFLEPPPMYECTAEGSGSAGFGGTARYLALENLEQTDRALNFIASAYAWEPVRCPAAEEPPQTFPAGVSWMNYDAETNLDSVQYEAIPSGGIVEILFGGETPSGRDTTVRGRTPSTTAKLGGGDPPIAYATLESIRLSLVYDTGSGSVRAVYADYPWEEWTILEVAETDGWSDRPTSAATDDALLVAYERNEDIYLARWPDGADAFDAPINVSDTPAVASSAAAVASTSAGILVANLEGAVYDWSDGEPAQVVVALSSDGGESFGAPVQISGGEGRCGAPRITVVGETVLVTYGEDVEGVDRAQLVRSTDGGATWGAPADPTGFAAAAVTPVASDDGIVLFGASAAPGDVFAWRSEDEGATFEGAVNVSASEADSSGPVPAAIEGGFGVLYGEEGSLLWSRSTDGGATWSAPIDVAPGVAVSSWASKDVGYIAPDLYAAYQYGGEIFVATSTDNGATFSEPVNVSSDEDESSSPRISKPYP